MNTEQFDEMKWSINTKVLYNGKQVKLVGVDFETNEVIVRDDDNNLSIQQCSEIEVGK